MLNVILKQKLRKIAKESFLILKIRDLMIKKKYLAVI